MENDETQNGNNVDSYIYIYTYIYFFLVRVQYIYFLIASLWLNYLKLSAFYNLINCFHETQ